MATSEESQQQSKIIEFFDPNVEAPMPRNGATLSKVLTWSDDKLEYVHDFIQWLFPLPEASAFSASAEELTKADYDAFHTRPELRERLREGLRRMCKFYGLELLDAPNEDGVLVVKADDFMLKAYYTWLFRYSHNHNRISRIIRSLRILGLADEAHSFALALFQLDPKSIVNSTARMYWCRAALWPLAEAPSGKEHCRWLEGLEDRGSGAEAVKKLKAYAANLEGV